MVPQNLLLASSVVFFGGNNMKEEEFFEEYTSKYNKKSPGISLKYNHSFRVVKKSEQIGKSIRLNKEDMELVRVCALLHDIARFEQYRIYNNFDDSKSFDHGDKGREILEENGITNEIVLDAVKYHNKYEIPKDLDERNKLFLKIIRDADKVDILEHQGMVVKTKNYTIPKEIKNFFIEHKSIGHDVKANPEGNIINILRMLAFIFDLNYKESFRMIKEKNIVNIKCDLIKEQGIKGIEEIRKICNEYVESRL